ncbi:MAG: hypothetical protein QS98_C0003G0027 [archaeon GW2011_AR3]|nr:MAG: hypothetical protein QS98_C0003G0027 [archaeon GW2011_AR3]MBS3110069.1 hypothetical protein [Candidatus Woesearchaeota archaeon]
MDLLQSSTGSAQNLAFGSSFGICSSSTPGKIAFFSLEPRKMLYVKIDKPHKIDAKTKSLGRASSAVTFIYDCSIWKARNRLNHIQWRHILSGKV